MSLTLKLHQKVNLRVEDVFELWTHPEHIIKWWGPSGVTCIAAEIDLKIGGVYQLDNLLEDGTKIRISGEYLEIDPPHFLKFTWCIQGRPAELVSVRFVELKEVTEIIVTHSQIETEDTKRSHREGWLGCFHKMQIYKKLI